MKIKSLHERGHAGHIAVWNVPGTVITLVTGLVIWLLLAATGQAATTISQGYTTNNRLPLGALVSLRKDTADQVIGASVSNVDNLFGVVIAESNSLLSVSNGQENQVQVANSGTVPVLVSDINGSIARGDHVTASPITGVGMKATGNVRVIGIAQGNASGNEKQSYKDQAGAEQTTIIGEAPVLVNVSYFFKEPEKTVVPSAIQNLANAVAGKSVNTLPILISAAIFLVTIIVVASMIYSMIKSSIISVGRNPLSQSAVYRGLVQLSLLALVILAVGFGSIYMVLTRL